MRQHRRFSELGRVDGSLVQHMSQVGHFEFGLNRIPIHTGDQERYREITHAWSQGDEVRGWALYWDAVYRHVYDQIQSMPKLRDQTRFVRFETLCADPGESIRALLVHSLLSPDASLVASWERAVKAPEYEPSQFSHEDLALIRRLTNHTANLYDYFSNQ